MSRAIRILVLVMMTIGFYSLPIVDASSFRIGDQGSDIAEIQGELASLGYDVVADGAFGPATEEAIKSFQSSRGLTADGLVGPQTYETLMGRNMPDVSRGVTSLSRRVVADSMRYLGVPYVFGGTTPRGFDCSGYVRYVFAQAGIYLPRTADAQYECGYSISTGDLRAGDLVFFTTYTYGASHVGIYLSDGNFINAASSVGVSIASLYDSYWSSRYIGARRVI